eukprot:360289-Prymnesium_polylepis.1
MKAPTGGASGVDSSSAASSFSASDGDRPVWALGFHSPLRPAALLCLRGDDAALRSLLFSGSCVADRRRAFFSPACASSSAGSSRPFGFIAFG